MTTFLGVCPDDTAPRGVGQLRGSVPFPRAARVAVEDAQLRRNLAHATTSIRAKAPRPWPSCPTGSSCAEPVPRSRRRRWPVSTST